MEYVMYSMEEQKKCILPYLPILSSGIRQLVHLRDESLGVHSTLNIERRILTDRLVPKSCHTSGIYQMNIVNKMSKNTLISGTNLL